MLVYFGQSIHPPHQEGEEYFTIDYYYCLNCRETFGLIHDPVNYCPGCGVRDRGELEVNHSQQKGEYHG